jgi:hypothetical protein
MTSQEFLDDLWGSPTPEVPIKSSNFNSVKLAQYFQTQLQSAQWYKGFGIVNLRALAGQIAKLKGPEVTAETVYAMIDRYMADHTMRGKAPGWQDFIYQRDRLVSSLSNTGENTQPLDKWDQRAAEYDEDEEMRQYLAERNK